MPVPSEGVRVDGKLMSIGLPRSPAGLVVVTSRSRKGEGEMAEKQMARRVYSRIGIFIPLLLILSVRSEAVMQQVLNPVRVAQPLVIAVTAGESRNVLVPGPLPKTQARLVTIPSAGA